VVAQSTGKQGRCGRDLSLPYKLLLKDYKFAQLLVEEKEEMRRQRKRNL